VVTSLAEVVVVVFKFCPYFTVLSTPLLTPSLILFPYSAHLSIAEFVLSTTFEVPSFTF
jgi:hypothetical protein